MCYFHRVISTCVIRTWNQKIHNLETNKFKKNRYKVSNFLDYNIRQKYRPIGGGFK